MIKAQSNGVVNDHGVPGSRWIKVFLNTVFIRSFLIPWLNLPADYKLAAIILLDRLLVTISVPLCCKEWFTPEAAGL